MIEDNTDNSPLNLQSTVTRIQEVYEDFRKKQYTAVYSALAVVNHKVMDPTYEGPTHLEYAVDITHTITALLKQWSPQDPVEALRRSVWSAVTCASTASHLEPLTKGVTVHIFETKHDMPLEVACVQELYNEDLKDSIFSQLELFAKVKRLEDLLQSQGQVIPE